MYFVNVFTESKDNDHITSILARSDTNTRFFSKKRYFFKTVKPFIYHQTPSNIFGNTLKIKIMIRND